MGKGGSSSTTRNARYIYIYIFPPYRCPSFPGANTTRMRRGGHPGPSKATDPSSHASRRNPLQAHPPRLHLLRTFLLTTAPPPKKKTTRPSTCNPGHSASKLPLLTIHTPWGKEQARREVGAPTGEAGAGDAESQSRPGVRLRPKRQQQEEKEEEAFPAAQIPGLFGPNGGPRESPPPPSHATKRPFGASRAPLLRRARSPPKPGPRGGRSLRGLAAGTVTDGSGDRASATRTWGRGGAQEPSNHRHEKRRSQSRGPPRGPAAAPRSSAASKPARLAAARPNPLGPASSAPSVFPPSPPQAQGHAPPRKPRPPSAPACEKASARALPWPRPPGSAFQGPRIKGSSPRPHRHTFYWADGKRARDGSLLHWSVLKSLVGGARLRRCALSHLQTPPWTKTWEES